MGFGGGCRGGAAETCLGSQNLTMHFLDAIGRLESLWTSDGM